LTVTGPNTQKAELGGIAGDLKATSIKKKQRDHGGAKGGRHRSKSTRNIVPRTAPEKEEGAEADQTISPDN